MRLSRPLKLTATATAFIALTACSSIPFFGNSGNDDKEQLDKAGRVTMVLAEEAVEAKPELATESIELLPPTDMASWPEAGGTPAKAPGHVNAAPDLKIAWRNSVGKGSSNKSAVTTPPVASETAIYTLDADQTIYSTEISSGRTLWKKELKGLTKRDKTALGGGLAVTDGTLIVASGFGYVTRVSAEDGTELWKRELGVPMTGAPTVKDGTIFVASNNNEVFALDLETGETDWSDQAIAESARVLGSPSPAAIEDFVIAPYSSGELIAYLANNGRRLWTDAISQAGRFTPISEINDIGSRPVLAGGLVFASSQSGITVAIDGRSGNRVWARPIGSTQAPALSGKFLFVIGTNATLAALDAGSGDAYWVTELPQYKNEKKKKKRISYSGPLLASGRILIVSSYGELLAFDPQTGEQTASLDIKDTTYIEPIAVQGKVFLLTDEAKLVAIQ
ncbi:MAG: PQQ-binding-like beta-propeller repeat protein [Hyphomonas sp.]|uniref:PQQ-like beta-propeller repeat protein n=1 Tax=Hyphomonas sp. TaxID=87 RepID=UPI001B10AD25|nr:PQQ-like beta-propeller repeat protein [Hyphomonas sp.]MBO6581824.1 PQQ-binding-like beta-propeller repeat protein [Hyphomonas sp.]